MTPLADVITRVESSGPDLALETFTYIDLSSINAGDKMIAMPKQVRVGDAASRARQQVRSGDVLVSTVRPNLNGVAIVPGQLNGAIASTGFCVLRSEPSRLDSRYLFHWVRSEQFIKEMVRQSTGASYPAVSDSIVKSSAIPLPPLPEQRRIADILDRADELRIKRRRALALLDELAGALFAATARVSQANTSERVLLGDLVVSSQNGLYRPSGDYGSGTPILRIADFSSGEKLRLENLSRVRLTERKVQRFELRPSDLIVNRVNAMSHLGKSALVCRATEATVFESNMMRLRVDETRVKPEYVLAWLQSAEARSQINSSAKQAINQASINQRDIAALELLLPDLRLQRVFVSRIERVDSLRTLHREKLAALDELFASLQNRAFSGQL